MEPRSNPRVTRSIVVGGLLFSALALAAPIPLQAASIPAVQLKLDATLWSPSAALPSGADAPSAAPTPDTAQLGRVFDAALGTDDTEEDALPGPTWSVPDLASQDGSKLPASLGAPGFGGHPADQEVRWAAIPLFGLHVLDNDRWSVSVNLPPEDQMRWPASTFGLGLSYSVPFR